MEGAVTAEYSKAADAKGAGWWAALSRWARSTLLILSGLLSLLVASAANAQYEPPQQMTLTPTRVDLNTGRFTYDAVDFSIGPFTLERSYIGGPTIDGSAHFGLNWSHNYSIYVVEKDQSKTDGVYVVIGRKTVHFTWSRYTAATDFACWHPDCAGQRLQVAGSGAIVYTDMQGNVYTFSPTVKAFPPPSNMPTLRNQRIDRIDYADGHTLTYTYAPGNSGQLPQLKQIASNRGYSLIFENNGPSGYISRACGYNRANTQVTTSTTCASAALAVSYDYAPATWVNLTSVTDPMKQVWQYDYRGDSNRSKMTCVHQVNSSDCLIANNFFPPVGSGLTLQQTTADGAVWGTNFDPGKDGDAPPASSTQPVPYGTSYFGPEGISIAATFEAGLLKSYNVNGRTTSLTYNGVELETLTHPEGNSVKYFPYGEIRLSETWSPKPGSGLQPVTTSMQLPPRAANSDFCDPSIGPKLCNKPIWREDYNGNRTEYTYWPEHGGVKAETGPAVNGVRPQKRYTYVQRIASGAPAGPGTWLVNTVSFCRTANFTNGRCEEAGVEKPGDEVVTTFDYEPNNLNIRSETVTAGGISRRTCFTYDWLGNQTSAAASNGTCS
jgi:hypothetical protein